MKAVQNDMTAGEPMKLILSFTLPIFIGNVFQQFYNMADAVIVGKFVGNQALAAVGSCQRPVGIFVSIFWLAAILQILQQGKRQHDDAKDYKNDTGCTV